MVIDEWSPFLPTRVDPKISILSEGGKEEEEDEEEVDQMLGGEWLDCSALFFLLCHWKNLFFLLLSLLLPLHE